MSALILITHEWRLIAYQLWPLHCWKSAQILLCTANLSDVAEAVSERFPVRHFNNSWQVSFSLLLKYNITCTFPLQLLTTFDKLLPGLGTYITRQVISYSFISKCNIIRFLFYNCQLLSTTCYLDIYITGSWF